jgi:alpha-amylase
MPALNICFKLHLPWQLNDYTAGSVGTATDYFNTAADGMILDQLADECYLPANAIIANLVAQHQGKFKINFSISGTALQLLQEHRPDVIDSFRQLAATGCIEFLAETYYNSLSWLYSKKEFRRQVEMHSELVQSLFSMQPAVLRNTELVYNNEMAAFAQEMGFKGIWCEGIDHLLRGRSPNQLYAAPGAPVMGLLLRNAALSDDIAFRFDEPQWSGYPLTAGKYAAWIHTHVQADNINLLMDYETFGLHKKKSTGIFEFLENLPGEILSKRDWIFSTSSEIVEKLIPAAVYDVAQTISWCDKEIECCVWCENAMQNNMLKKIYSLEYMAHKTSCPNMLQYWGLLQSADHFYYMSDKGRTMHDAYQNRNPFASAEEAYQNYLNIITDFEIKLIEQELLAYKNLTPHLKHSTLY